MFAKKTITLFFLIALDLAIFAGLAASSSSGIVGWAFLNVVVIVVIVVVKFGGYRRERYGIKCITLNGERVRSKSEKFIADYFYQNGIQYRYERPARTRGIDSKHISKPDFYLEDYHVYVEYWGLVNIKNDRKKESYIRTMKWKMAQYHNNNIKFISIYPDNLNNLDWIFRRKLKEVTGVDLENTRS